MPDVRTIRGDEIDRYWTAVTHGFHRWPREGDAAYYGPRVDPSRTLAAFDGAHIVGTATSFRTPLSIPGGGYLDVAGVTEVTVSATHRRQGLLTRMMARQLDDVAARGEPMAVLIASEAPIYGRFGYGPATEWVEWKVDARRARFVDGLDVGPVRRVSATELRVIAPEVFRKHTHTQHGEIGREDWWWDREYDIVPAPVVEPMKGERFFVVAGGDTPEGYVDYRIHTSWDGRVSTTRLEIEELIAITPSAYRSLWRHCLGVDWVATVEAELRPPVEPLQWMVTDPRTVAQRHRTDFVWVRLLDIPAALAARRYRVHDRLVIEVTDAFRAGGGCFALEGSPSSAVCTPSDDDPALTVTVADLSAAYLGGTPLWPAAMAGRVEEHRRGAVAAFDRLFLTDKPPWCYTWF